MNNRLICCDWGTSKLRLYLVERSSCQVVTHVESAYGVAKVNNAFEAQTALNRVEFFSEFINKQIEQLEKECGSILSYTPVTLSGMASSSIGLVNVEYTDLPLSLSKPDLKSIMLDRSERCDHDLYVFGGLMSHDDVMRGEEVQLLGLKDKLRVDESLCILPGTHSKHVRIENGTISHFDTFMTGEFFDLLSRHSILKNSVVISKMMNQEKREAFEQGLKKGLDSNLLKEIFKIRTRDVLTIVSPELNYYYLSGLMIGSELSAVSFGAEEIVICGGHELSDFYEIAFDVLYNDKEVKVISQNEMMTSVPQAHVRLFNQQLETTYLES